MGPIRNTKILLILFLMSLSISVFGIKIGNFENILKPDSMVVQGNRIYITEGYKIHIISQDDLNTLSVIGKKGEGPGEFKGKPVIEILSDCMLINSGEKVLFFTHDGKYMKEMRSIGHNSKMLPIASGYVGRKNIFIRKDGYATQKIGIYDRKLDLIKEIYQEVMPGIMKLAKNSQGKYIFPLNKDCVDYRTYADKIFIADSTKGIHIVIYDLNGTKLKLITLPHQRIKVSQDFKNREIERMSKTPWMKNVRDRFILTFREYFPAFRHFSVTDNKIYIATYVSSREKFELIILDFNGNILKKLFVPQVPYNSDRPLYSIDQGFYYYLLENPETDTWELHKEVLF